MRALRVERHGEPQDVLALREIEAPVPGPGQVVVRVGAAALNWPDVNLCRGVYHLKPALPFTPGMEACGTIAGVGAGEPTDLVGRRVVGPAALPAGALAELMLMQADRVQPVPDGIDDAAAAATFIAFTTAHLALHRRARLAPHETLLVHAAAGGVGSAAVQLGKVIGARVIAVARGEAKRAACLDLGADVFVDSAREDVAARVRDETGGVGVDVIFDPVGGDAFEQSRRCVAPDGRILVVGFASGTIPTVSVNSLLYRSYSVLGVYLAAYRDQPGDAAYRAGMYAEIADLLLAGRIRAVISAEIPLEEAPTALSELARRDVVGKIVVRPA